MQGAAQILIANRDRDQPSYSGSLGLLREEEKKEEEEG